MNEHTRRLYAIAEELGFTFERRNGNGHLVFHHPNGSSVTMPATPSDYRGLLNSQLQLERAAGRKLPRVNKRRSRKAVKPSGFSIAVATREAATWRGLYGADVDALHAERAALIAKCERHAQRRDQLRAIPPLLDRIAAIELRLVSLHQPVERFDPFTLAKGA